VCKFLVSVSISALLNVSSNFARYSDVVSSTRVVFVRYRNWISDFRGVHVHIHILAVFRLSSTRFSTRGVARNSFWVGIIFTAPYCSPIY